MPFDFWVPGAPVAKARPRVGKLPNGVTRLYTPKKTTGWEQHVAFFVANKMVGDPLANPIEVDIDFMLPIPKSWSKRRTQEAINGEIAHTKKPDLDNLVKAVKDALNGVLWHDDRQVVSLHCTKMYAPIVGVKISVTPLDQRLA